MRGLLLAVVFLLDGARSIRVADIDAPIQQVTSELVAAETGGAARALVPANYFTAEGAANRCKQARRGRWTRRVVGAVTGLLVAIPVGLVTGFTYLSAYWVWYLNGQTILQFAATAGVGALSLWSTFLLAKGGSRVGVSITDVFARLVGADGHKSSCCCLESEGKRECALVGTSQGRRTACPEGSTHDAAACPAMEVLSYSSQTAGGCECKNPKNCETNKFHRGHAWCTVKSGRKCSPQKRAWNFKHWDYCKVEETTLPNSTNTVNSALSKFVINLDKSSFRSDPRSVWRLGSWVDTSKALVIARVKIENKYWKQSSCFAGDQEETLESCAESCIEDGAPIADERNTGNTSSLPCHAFAYNRLQRLCVRLPKDATGAEFKPFQRNPRLGSNNKRDGWQNYKRVDFD